MLPSKKEQNERVKLIAQVFNNEWANWSPEFEEYTDGYNYLMGEQYTADQKSWYKSERRPVNVWNIIFPMFNRILGDFLLNQTYQKVYSKVGGNPQVAALIQKMLETVQINTDYKDEMAMTILAGLVKRGYVYPRFSNERQIDGSIVITNIDEYEIMFDSRAINYYFDDAHYMIRSKWLTTDQIYALYPNHRSKLQEFIKDKEDSAFLEACNDYETAMLYHRNFADEVNGKYRVIEFHSRIWRPEEILYDPTTNQSEILVLEGKRREVFLKHNPQLEIIETDNAEIIQIEEVIPALHHYLNKADADIQDKHFDYIPLSPYPYGKKAIKSFGIFKNAKGPQNEFNDLRNRMLDIMNKAAKPTQAIKPDGISNWKTIKSKGNAVGQQILVKEAAKIDEVFKRFEPPSLPFADAQMSESAYDLLHRIVGLTQNLKGEQQTSAENASLFYQRTKQAEKSFVPIDRCIKRTTTRLHNRVIKLLQINYSTETTFAIFNPMKGTSEEVILNQVSANRVLNNMNVGEYAVFPSQEEVNPTLRHARFLEKTELVRMAFDMVGPVGIDFRWWLENSDFEDVEKFIQSLEKAQAMLIGQEQESAAANQMNTVMSLARERLALEAGGGDQGQQNLRSKQQEAAK